jgi:hypothetical protein
MEESAFWKNFQFSTAILILAWLGVVVCFIPSIMYFPTIHSEGYHELFNSTTIHQMELSAFIITIPLIVDLVLDIMFSKISWQVANARFTILFSVSGTYLMQYLLTFQPSLSFRFRILMFMNNTYARQMLLFSGIIAYILTHSPIILKAKIGGLIVAVVLIANVCLNSITVFTNPGTMFDTVKAIVGVFNLLSVFIVTVTIITWGLLKRRRTTTPEALMIICSICISSNLFSKLIGIFAFNSVVKSNMSVHAYYVFIISDMATVVILCIIPGRLVRYKVVVTEVTYTCMCIYVYKYNANIVCA